MVAGACGTFLRRVVFLRSLVLNWRESGGGCGGGYDGGWDGAGGTETGLRGGAGEEGGGWWD